MIRFLVIGGHLAKMFASWTMVAMRIEPLFIALVGTGLYGVACGSSGGGGGGGGPGWKSILTHKEVDILGGSITTDGSRVVEGTNYGVFVSGDEGATWQNFTAGLPANTTIEALITLDDRVIAGSEGALISKDHGTTWTDSSMGLSLNVSVYAFFDTGTAVLVGMNAAGTNGGVFRSSDKGVTWQMAGSGLPQTTGASSFAKLGSTVLAAAGGTVAKSSDDGKTWQTSMLPAGNALSMVNLDGTIYLSSSSSKVYKSTDSNVWTDSSQGLPNDPSDLLFISGGVLYATAFASGGAGIYVSRDKGASWQAYNEGLTTAGGLITPRLIAMAEHGGALFGVDETGTVWKR
jgi:hypothetical protein